MSSLERIRPVLAVLAVAALAVACGGGSAPESAAAPEADTPPAVEAPSDGAPAAEAGAAEGEAAGDAYDPANAAGAVVGVPAPTNTAPIEAVANFYTELPGFDLSGFSTPQREKFLHRVNSEMCTCGCKNDTLARCLVNDPKCPTVKGLMQAVYDEVRTGR